LLLDAAGSGAVVPVDFGSRLAGADDVLAVPEKCEESVWREDSEYSAVEASAAPA